jgi:hypothetical protein
MSNGIYNYARYMLSTANLDWRAADMVLTAWSGTPTFNPQHRVVADLVAVVGAANKLGDSLPIVDSTVDPEGYNQTSAVVIQGVAVSKQVNYFTMSLRAGVPEQSELLLFVDTASGLPFVSNNLEIVVIPDWAENRGWFRA